MAKRVDANQRQIVEALRSMGCSVETRLSQLGQGAPDLLVGKCGKSIVMEVKSGSNCLTEDEKAWKASWKGSYAVVRSPEQAIEVMEDLIEQ